MLCRCFHGAGAKPDEVTLLEKFHMVGDVFRGLHPKYRAVITDITHRMAEGMIQFAEKPVDSYADYNLYCHYVAGLVGIGLSQMFAAGGEDPWFTSAPVIGPNTDADHHAKSTSKSAAAAKKSTRTTPGGKRRKSTDHGDDHDDGHGDDHGSKGGAVFGVLDSPPGGLANAMGLFLQKTNIIRDYLEDQVDQRTFWPREIWGRYAPTLASLRPGHSSAADPSAPTSSSTSSSTSTSSSSKSSSSGNGGWVSTTSSLDVSVACLDAMITDALSLAPFCLEYLSRLEDPLNFNFCVIPQIMAAASLAELYDNPKVFSGVVKIRRGLTARMMVGTKSMAQCRAWFRTYALDIQRKMRLASHTRSFAGMDEKDQKRLIKEQAATDRTLNDVIERILEATKNDEVYDIGPSYAVVGSVAVAAAAATAVIAQNLF